MRTASLVPFSGSIPRATSLARESAWQRCSGSFTAMGGGSGRRDSSARVPHSSSPWAGRALDYSPVTSGIPEDVRRFLLQCIDSVEQLEVLLLLHGAPAQAWNAEAVAQALYSNPDSIARRLAGLHANGLVAP